jgi:CSLREA domain-containing protein
MAPRWVLAVAALALLSASSAWATNFTVTDNSLNPTDVGSLLYALNNLATGSAATTNTITITATGTITLTRSLPTISNGVTITGPGANHLTISGANAYKVFTINSGDVVISGLTIANGVDPNDSVQHLGGGIYNNGTVTVSDCTFYGNLAANGFGAAIFNAGVAVVSNSTFYNNSVTDTGSGGIGSAIYNFGTSLTVFNSTFTENSAGLSSSIGNGSGTATLTNNTFYSNSSAFNAEVVNYNSAKINANNNLFSSEPHGALYNSGGTLNASSNLYWNTSATCTACASDTNSISGDPKLLPLGNYGGTTETLALAPGSAAICASSSTYAVDASSNPLTSDQRGFVMDPSCASGSVDAGAVQTNQYVVTTLADQTDTSPTCTGGATCSLRDAIGLANATKGDITFKASLTSVKSPGTITLGAGSAGDVGLPAIAGQVNILGTGANQLTVSGNKDANVGSVFTINPSATATLYGLTISNGYNLSNVQNGGGINNSGTTTVLDCSVSGNNAAGIGGGISNLGAMTVADSTISGNFGFGAGGGIATTGAMTITGSTISGNSAGSVGANLSAVGGGIYASGTLTIVNSTISRNSVSDGSIKIDTASGGGIDVVAGTANLANTIVAGNTLGQSIGSISYADIEGNYNDNGGNVAGTSASSTSQINIQLGPLQYNGTGATVQTMIPLPGSPAICAGLTTNIPSGMTTDERGFPLSSPSYCTPGQVDAGAVQTNYTSIAFAQQPSDTAVNTAITPSPAVEVTETNAITNTTDTVAGLPITLDYSGGAGELSGGSASLTATSGSTTIGTNTVNAAVFSLTPTIPGASFSLSLGAGGTGIAVGSKTFSETSNSFDVYGAAASLQIVATTPVTAGGSTSVTVTAMDANGNTVLNDNDTVNLVLTGQTTSLGTVTLSGGTGSTNITLTTAGTYTLTGTDTTTSITGQSNSIVVGANTPMQIVVSGYPVSVYAGVPQTATVMVEDAYGNPVTAATGTATVTTSESTTGIPVTITSGMGIFTAVFATTGTSQSISVSGLGLTGVPETGITVNAIPSLVVTNTNDSGTGSLRAALATAATDGAGNITFDPGMFSTAQTIRLTSGVVNLPAYTTITGPTAANGANLVTVSGGGTQQVFNVAGGVSGAVINDLNIANGFSTSGGGISNLGSLTVNHSSFTGNSASPAGSNTAGSGGAIFSQGGTLAVNNSSFTSNSASPPGASSSGYGGAICSIGGTLTVAGSTFSRNSASASNSGGNAYGGAIFSTSTSLTVSNSTFSGNTASATGSSNIAYGGAIWGVNTVTLSDSTFSGNSATASGSGAQGVGGAIWSASTLTVTGSIFSGNSASTSAGGINLSGGVLSVGTSLFTSDTGGECITSSSGCPTNGVNGNVVGAASANLAPLGNYGGPTQTMIPLPGSPAICLINPSVATGMDQRGDPRTTAYNSTSCQDAGAVQTDYALVFSGEPAPISPATAIEATAPFTAGATVEENGAPFFDGKDIIPVMFTLTTGSGALTGGSTATTATSGAANATSLEVSLPGTSDQLTATLVLNGTLVLTKTSSLFSVSQVPTTTTLGVSTGSGTPGLSLNVIPGQSVTLTATVSSTVGTPTGTVNFYDGGMLLNATPVTLSAGVAKYTLTTLTPGVTNALTAAYNGTPAYATSSNTSTSTVTVASLDFTVDLSGLTAQTVIPGQSVSYMFTVTPDYGSYAGTVTFAATGLPAGATATFSPPSIAVNGGPQTVTVTIQTAPSTAMEHAPAPPGSAGRRAAPLALAFLLLFGLGAVRKRGKGLRNLLCAAVLLAGGAAATMLSGCGGGINGFFAQSPQNYSITITATANGLTHSKTVTLNVQ